MWWWGIELSTRAASPSLLTRGSWDLRVWKSVQPVSIGVNVTDANVERRRVLMHNACEHHLQAKLHTD